MRENTLSGRRKMFGWTAVAFIAAVIILCGTIHIFASSGDSRPYNKYYAGSIVLQMAMSAVAII